MNNHLLNSKSPSVRKSAVVATIALTLLGGSVHAGTPTVAPSAPPTSGGIVGVGVVNMPAYLGSDQQRNQIIVPIDYRWGNGVFINRKGVGFNASSSATIQFGPLLNVGQERNESLATALRGMGDVQANLEYGGFLSAQLAPGWEINLALMAGAGTDNAGRLISVGGQYKTKLTPTLELGLNLDANYANAAYMNTYFGIDTMQSKSSGYSGYRLADGLRDISSGLSLGFQMTPGWFLIGGVSISTLSEAAKKSPIVRKSEGTTVFFGLAHAFYL